MSTIGRIISGTLVAIIILGIIWYTNRDSFHLGIFGGPQSCRSEIALAADQAVLLFEQRAYEIVSGTDVSEPVTKSEFTDPESWSGLKPSLATIRKFLNTDNIVEIAISNLRRKIADDQTADPNSLIGKHKQFIRNGFNNAANWCDRLPRLQSSTEKADNS